MNRRTTHTLAELELSQASYDEIAGKLHEAGYEHAFGIGNDAGLIDMQGIGVTRADDPTMQGMSYAMCEKKARDNFTVTVGFFTLADAQAFHQWCCQRARDASKVKPT
jgi:hypothetical protein